MEDLNKHQIILLTLLVSFVTSIATGIITVTLMEQTPQNFSQTINRVVERTVERVVPGEDREVIKEVPVIITEEDLVVKAINSASGAVVRVFDVSAPVPKPISSGFILEDGRIVTVIPKPIEENVSASINPSYQISIEPGKNYGVEKVVSEDSSGLLVLKVRTDRQEDYKKELEKKSLLKFSTKQTIVGQTAIGIGSSSGAVSVNIISNITSSSTEATGIVLKTNASNQENLGGPLLDIHGEVIGVNMVPGFALSRTTIKQIIDQVN